MSRAIATALFSICCPLVAAAAVALTILVYWIKTAPYGFEDETGYYQGRPDDAG